jgi:hypothetical protein
MTSSELLIDTLTKFGTSEPTGVVVIWTDEAGDIAVVSNCAMSSVTEYAKLATFKAMVPK